MKSRLAIFFVIFVAIAIPYTARAAVSWTTMHEMDRWLTATIAAFVFLVITTLVISSSISESKHIFMRSLLTMMGGFDILFSLYALFTIYATVSIFGIIISLIINLLLGYAGTRAIRKAYGKYST